MNNNKLLNCPPPKCSRSLGFQIFGFGFSGNENVSDVLDAETSSALTCEKTNAHKFAFTLSEILTILTILGIVASITIPNSINTYFKTANKTKIKKALATYEAVINKIVVANNHIKSTEALNNYAKNDANCSNAMSYFKATEQEGCTFRTADGLWWDVTDISNTLVSFEKENLSWVIASGDENKAFRFVAKFDENSILRINDLNWGKTTYNPSVARKQESENPLYVSGVEKTYAYLNNEEYTENIFAKYAQPCQNGVYINCTTYGNAVDFYNCYNKIYDEQGRRIGHTMACSSKGDKHSYTRSGVTNFYENGKEKDDFDECTLDQSYCTHIGFFATNGTTNNWYGGTNCSISNGVAICEKLAAGRSQLCADNESIVPCPNNPEKNCYAFKLQDEYKITNDLWAPKN